MENQICRCSPYRPARPSVWLWVLAVAVVSEANAGEQSGPSISPAARDSLVTTAEQHANSGAHGEAVEILGRLVDAFPDDVNLLTRQGYALLKTEDFESAIIAFESAKRLESDVPGTHVGLGLARLRNSGRGLEAFFNFRQAVGEARSAIEINAAYGPAYRLLGEAYGRFEEDHEKALGYYTTYIELEPDNPEGRYEFGISLVQLGQFDKIDQYVTPFIETHPSETRLIPLAAQAHFYLERFGRALELFERYLQTLDPAERGLYTDISLVASEGELEAYRAAPAEEKATILERFWLKRDSDILTAINERVIEHYRRVWFARTFFATGASPWDKRGEVYIRYGEPDYRSRSTRRQFVQNPKVQAVRDRMAVALYGDEAALLTFTGPVFPVRANRSHLEATLFDQQVTPDAADATTAADDFGIDASQVAALAEKEQDPMAAIRENSRFDEFGNLNTRLNFGGYAPITLDNEVGTVPWETWTYTRIGNGMEITFTDERGTGAFDFAPIPPPSLDTDVSGLARFTEYAPRVIFRNAVSRTPDVYRPRFHHPPLDFYFDLASFRAPDGGTTLEVYYGIPAAQVQVGQRRDVSYIQVRCALALAPADYSVIHRTSSSRAYRVASDFSGAQKAFMPELLKLQVPPGKYDLQVQIKDLLSGHNGIYRQTVDVKEYPADRLRISDIQLAATIGETKLQERFKKGEVWVVPMPTRNYRGAQQVYAYYEIYNLKKNRFGQTRYKVKYVVRYVSKPIRGALGSVASGLRSLFRSKRPSVSISYEHEGTEPNEQSYLEIDLDKVKHGVNVLEVEIKDLVSGKSEEREIRFQYGG
ncbi:MAG: GWxTD domain-containing protein [Gemmatimonadota bacterium]|nr:GWxTD domain-containing protein [Gemmatimonadota bacterium]